MGKKGTSGNPRGRPKRGAALTELLLAVGEQTAGRSRKQKKQVLAEMVWNLVLKGHTKLPSGVVVKADERVWLDAVKWLYGHADPAAVRARLSLATVGRVVVDLRPGHELESSQDK